LYSLLVFASFGIHRYYLGLICNDVSIFLEIRLSPPVECDYHNNRNLFLKRSVISMIKVMGTGTIVISLKY
jgi:hypothetical protein